jgi:hypothetical protein
MANKDYFLTPEGIFDPLARFAFTNITEEDFVTAWNGSPVTIKPGMTIEVGHSQAQNFTKQLVDKIIIGNAKLDELAKDKPYYVSPTATHLGIPAMRKVWEDKIVHQMKADEESPKTQLMRAQIKAELLADMSREPSGGSPVLPASLGDFADLVHSQDAPEKAPLQVKTIDATVE